MGCEDAAQVAVLVVQLGYERSVEELVGWIARLAGVPGQAAFVACVGEDVVGWIEVSIRHDLQTAPFGLIGGLVVKDGVRGQGIGRQLCERAERWAWEHGLAVLRVTSRSTRVEAHRFYRNAGYESVKTSMVFEKARPRG